MRWSAWLLSVIFHESGTSRAGYFYPIFEPTGIDPTAEPQSRKLAPRWLKTGTGLLGKLLDSR